MPFARDLCTLIDTKSCFCNAFATIRKQLRDLLQFWIQSIPTACSQHSLNVKPYLSTQLNLYIKHHIKILNCFVLENNLFKTFEKFYLKHYLKIQLGRKIRLQYRQHLVTNTKNLYWSIQKEPKIAQFSKNAC